jgi:Flp pilus assembly protein TadG
MNFFRHIARDQRGSTAVEFAFVGPPFLLLLLAIFELGLTLTTQSVMDGAARDAARLIRTGQVQTQVSPITTFQNLLCAKMGALLSATNCASNVIFEVQVFADFGSVSFTPCAFNANQTGTGTACQFSPGTGGQIVGVQASYPRPFIVPWVGRCLSGGNCWTGPAGPTGGTGTGVSSITLISTVIFRNEPFSS